MARVYTDENVVELSYLDLLRLLEEDVACDLSMPLQNRIKALRIVNRLKDLLEPYSAQNKSEDDEAGE